MNAISASVVMNLRRATGAGMMDCKKALAATSGNADAATDWLRARGLSKAAGKSSAAAADGLVCALCNSDSAVVLEINTQTDFAARSNNFQKAVRDIAQLALSQNGDIDDLKRAPAPDGSGTVSDMLVRMIATIGENINLRRMTRISCTNGVLACYVHARVADSLGRIGAIVALQTQEKTTPTRQGLSDIAHKVAMHVAAANPVAASREEIDPDILAREQTVITEQARQSGKPDTVIEKMIAGRLNRYFRESVLLEQTLVMNPDITVEEFIASESATLECPARLGGFAMLRVGEGIQITETDFAREVAATTRQD